MVNILNTTRMSSKGQVVIPEAVRNRLGWGEGDQFIVLGDRDVVILKALNAPSMRNFDALIQKARKQAKVAEMKRSDIKKAIAKVRGKR